MTGRIVWRRLHLWMLFPLLGGVLFVVALSLRAAPVPTDQDGNILKNASFEEETHGSPAVWNIEEKVLSKGSISLSRDYAHSGQHSLKLEPNRKNQPWDLEHDPLGVGQGFATTEFRGKRVHVSGWLAAQGDAAAVVAVLALGGKVPGLVRLKQTAGSKAPAFREDVLVVPDDASILVVICIVEGTEGAAYFDDVLVSNRVPETWSTGGPATAHPAGKDQAPEGGLQARVTVDLGQDIRRIPSTLYGMNIEWIWDGNGIWDTRRKGLDPNLVRLTKDLGVTLLRFPGGIFSDFYHWRDGVGPQDRRPTTPHLTEKSDSSVHTFGTDEALAFAERAGSRLLITVNAGTGTAEEAADWVRYVNHGSRRVDYWEIGNEIYVKMGHPAFVRTTMPPREYARKFRDFAKAMRAADPSIKIGAIGDENYGDLAPHAYGDWTSEVLGAAGGEMDFLAVHNAYAPQIVQDKGWPLRSVYAAMLAAPLEVKKSLEAASRKIDALGGATSPRISLAVTEWGPYFQTRPADRLVDHVKTLASGLYVASLLKVLVESPKTEIATGFQLVDQLFQGWIGKRQGEWVPNAPYYALQLYTSHFGSVLVRSTVEGPVYDSPPVGLVDAQSSVPYLDMVASRSDDGKRLYLIAINKHFDLPIHANIGLEGGRTTGKGTAWTLNGTGIDANTGTQPFQAPGVSWARQAEDTERPRFREGGPDEVTVTWTPLPAVEGSFEYLFPAHSVTALELALASRQ